MSDPGELLKYVRSAMPAVTDEEHERMQAAVDEEKPPTLILHVEIVEVSGPVLNGRTSPVGLLRLVHLLLSNSSAFVLVLCCLKASNLIGKDANGLSDPYCMLGIVPGSVKDAKAAETFLSEDENSDESKSRKTSSSIESTSAGCSQSGGKHALLNRNSSSGDMKASFIKRFSSFRRSDKSSKSSTSLLGSRSNKQSANRQVSNHPGNGSGSGKVANQLPAKYIQATSVQKATLSPVWGERFRFELDDVNTDTLHIDIWDHDDEVNVLEAVKKLNEVKGLKGKQLGDRPSTILSV